MNYSPLRYPGSKAKFYKYITPLIKDHEVYIEPFAGGASIALALVIEGKVKHSIINDLDEGIYAFWLSCINYTDELIRLINITDIDVDEHKKQKLIWKKKDLNDVIKLGFATFFLNRTNFSGILNAGPIGGLEQKGKYKINARFNKEGLIKKIKTIATYKDRFTILNKDAIEVIKMYNMPEYFMYIDPPYYTKGKELYMNYYKDKDHKKLERIVKTSNAKWFLSYDKCNFIEKLYEKYTKKTVDLKYSLSSNKSNKDAKELLINKNILGD